MDTLSIYLIFVIGGVIFEEIFVRTYFRIIKKPIKKNHSVIGRYLFLLLFPLIGTFLIINIHGWTLLRVFVTFFFIVPFFEWCIGYSYHQIEGTRLWTYHRYSISGYTNYLTAPLWGMAGVLFWLLANKLT